MFAIENGTITAQLPYAPQKDSIRYLFDISTTGGEIEIILDTGLEYLIACKSDSKIRLSFSYSWYGLTKLYFCVSDEYEDKDHEIIRGLEVPHSFIAKGLGETKIISCSGKELRKAYDDFQWMPVREF